MADSGELILQVRPAAGDDAGDLAETAGWLRAELLDLDVRGVHPLPGEDVPSGAKGVAAVAGWLLVQLGPETLRAVLAAQMGTDPNPLRAWPHSSLPANWRHHQPIRTGGV